MSKLQQPVAKRFSTALSERSRLTHSQVQIWTGQAVHPDSPFCNMAFAFVIEGPIDRQAFERAWQGVVDRSDALRTRVAKTSSGPERQLNPPGSCSLKPLDLSNSENPKTAFLNWAKERCAQRLELDSELVESCLCKLGPSRYGWYLNQHHLVTDAHATTLIFQEVSHSYQAFANGRDLPTSPARSYYEISQELAANSQSNNAPANGQANKSDPKPPTRSCSLYGMRGDPQRTQSERIEVRLSKECSDRIRKLATDSAFAHLFPDVSIFSLLNTALTSFLYRVSGQTQIGIDAPAGNRPTPEGRKTIGCFIEMFPLNVRIDPNDTFRSLATRMQDEIGIFLSQVAPAASSPNAANASNVVLNFFPGRFQNFANYETEFNWIHSGDIDGIYDLKLQVHDFAGSGAFTLQFDLSSDTFPTKFRERIPAHFQTLLNSMLEHLDTKINSIDLLTPEESQALMADYNRQSASPRPHQTVLQRFRERAQSSPEDLALSDANCALTYSELANTVERNARALRNLGVRQEATVIVALPRSVDSVVAILSILHAGGAFVPIDTSSAVERTKAIIADCNPSLAIVDMRHAITEALDAVPQVTIEGLSDIESEPDSPPIPQAEPSDLAYIIYTSGSTGKPKGVEVEHHALADYIDWAERMYVRGERLSFPLFTSLSFDLTLTSLFLPFVSGGRLIVYPQALNEVDSAIIDVVNGNDVDIVKLTPSHLTLLQRLDLSKSRIKRLVLGGEDLKSSLAKAISDQFGHPVEIYNEYGPTECVVGCMIHRFDPQTDVQMSKSVPIGKPADHTELFVLNDQMTPVPEGVPGELYVARKAMARGYRNDLDKTSKSFLYSPIAEGKRLYRTGDLVRFECGLLTYIGRIDKQIKLRGHRVELGEIESALLTVSGIGEAYVTTRSGAVRSPEKAEASTCCSRCGIPSNYPNIVFDEHSVCSVCRAYESIKDQADQYFLDKDALMRIFSESRKARAPKYDCMVFYSGGKDSSFALAKLVDLRLNVYAFTLDNGFLSDQALDNIRRVVKALGVTHEFASTPAMNEIFRDSLTRYSNVCNGCFKTIYTLGIKRAHELGIPIIVTGLSRGQFYETRLTENLFRSGRFSARDVDAAVLEARKRYHRENDAVKACLDTNLFESDGIFEEIQFVDFYRYWDAPLEELYRYLEERLPWIRPSDTGRSTNCRVNDVGIYIHQKERGFHNYALPYSWDVRLGQKRREDAIKELDDNYDLAEVRQMLEEIGYDEDRLFKDEGRTQIVAYYTSEAPLGADTLRAQINGVLPSYMVPQHFIHVERMPLTSNGKIDERALSEVDDDTPSVAREIAEPKGPVEQHVSDLWKRILRVPTVSIHDNFFRLGGASLTAMEITLQLCQDYDIDLPLQSIFTRPTVAELSAEIERAILQQIEALSDEEAASLLNDPSHP